MLHCSSIVLLIQTDVSPGLRLSGNPSSPSSFHKTAVLRRNHPIARRPVLDDIPRHGIGWRPLPTPLSAREGSIRPRQLRMLPIGHRTLCEESPASGSPWSPVKNAGRRKQSIRWRSTTFPCRSCCRRMRTSLKIDLPRMQSSGPPSQNGDRKRSRPKA